MSQGWTFFAQDVQLGANSGASIIQLILVKPFNRTKKINKVSQKDSYDNVACHSEAEFPDIKSPSFSAPHNTEHRESIMAQKKDAAARPYWKCQVNIDIGKKAFPESFPGGEVGLRPTPQMHFLLFSKRGTSLL